MSSIRVASRTVSKRLFAEYGHFINSFTIEENVFPFPNHIDPQGSIRVLPALPSFAEDLDTRLVL